MNIDFYGQNLKVTEAVEGYARKKLDRLDRYLPNIAEVRVDLSHTHTRRGQDLTTAQITLRHARGAILRAQVSTESDIEGAINGAVDKLYRQIERFKDKRKRKGHERFSASVEELAAAEVSPIESLDQPEEEAVVSVVRRKYVQVTAMHEEEAIEQMELLGHNFFVYYDEEFGGMSVVYKRNAGDYGILMPKLG
jgi:putative sigma-54 modulation protein